MEHPNYTVYVKGKALPMTMQGLIDVDSSHAIGPEEYTSWKIPIPGTIFGVFGVQMTTERG